MRSPFQEHPPSRPLMLLDSYLVGLLVLVKLSRKGSSESSLTACLVVELGYFSNFSSSGLISLSVSASVVSSTGRQNTAVPRCTLTDSATLTHATCACYLWVVSSDTTKGNVCSAPMILQTFSRLALPMPSRLILSKLTLCCVSGGPEKFTLRDGLVSFTALQQVIFKGRAVPRRENGP